MEVNSNVVPIFDSNIVSNMNNRKSGPIASDYKVRTMFLASQEMKKRKVRPIKGKGAINLQNPQDYEQELIQSFIKKGIESNSVAQGKFSYKGSQI